MSKVKMFLPPEKVVILQDISFRSTAFKLRFSQHILFMAICCNAMTNLLTKLTNNQHKKYVFNGSVTK